MSQVFALLRTGHVVNCPALKSPNSCQCEKILPRITGALALTASILEGTIGWIAGSSFTFADASHAAADSGTDFYGSRIARLAHEKPKNAAKIRRQGSRVIAAIMMLAIFPILWELVYHHGHLSPIGMVVAGGIAFLITSIRLHLLHQAQSRSKTATKADLIGHAKADLLHSFSVIIVGCIFGATERWSSIGSWIEDKLLITPDGADNTLACIVIVYILYQAIKIWRGKNHEHTH
jgi:divalent metal cation (Fe/Co/Zn/Cd) transporter